MSDAPRPERPTTAPEQVTRSDRWRSRPAMSMALRVSAAAVPALAAAGAAFAVGRAVPAPPGPAALVWWISLLGIATLVAMLVERVARRMLPLAVLLKLSLAFPDRAPSRFRLARSAGNVRQLHDRIAMAKEHGVSDDPSRAAMQILELVAALSAHDRKTRGHSERVRAFTDMLADELPLGPDDRDRLRWAALLHDVGKLRVPGRILNKPGKPDPYEWERLKEHPEAGARLVEPLLPWLGQWGPTIVQHHERFDGRGYPNGLAGQEISLGARLVSVADSFEVMTAARAYKRPMTVPAARRELAACAAAQFDPNVVRAFLNISLGRLWLAVGPTSWLAVTPVLGWLQRAASQLAIAAKTAAVASVFGAVGAIAQPTLAAMSPGGNADAPLDGTQPGALEAADKASDPTGGDAVGDSVDPADPDGNPGTGGPGGASRGPLDDPVGVIDDAVTDVGKAVADVAGAVGGTVTDVSGAADGVPGVVDGVTGTVAGTVDPLADPLGGTPGGVLGR